MGSPLLPVRAWHFLRQNGWWAFIRQTIKYVAVMLYLSTWERTPGAKVAANMWIDEPPSDATVTQPFRLAGWAIDMAADEGTGVDAVRIWACPAPGSGADRIFLGRALYGSPRPDVGAIFGSQFTNSGYQLVIAGLSPGPYEIVVEAYSTVNKTFNISWGVTVEVIEEKTSRAFRKRFPDPNRFQVLFLVGYVEGECKRYRVYNVQEQLALLGVETATVYEVETMDRLDWVSSFDLIVLMRAPISSSIRRLIALAKELDIPVVFEVDDYIFEPEIIPHIDGIRDWSEADKIVYEEEVERYRETLKLCDYFVAPTDYLAARAAELGKRAFVIRNGLNNRQLKLARDALKKRSRSEGTVRIGYLSGTKTHQKDFAVAGPALLKILEEFPQVVLCIQGYLDLDPRFEKFRERIELHPFVDWGELPYHIARLDINIAPLEVGNPFCEAKSELKYFESALLKIPTVASATNAFRFAIENGENGFLAETGADWYERLKKLVVSPELRREMGEKAYKHVTSTYTPRAQAEATLKVYQDIILDFRQRLGFQRDALSMRAAGRDSGRWKIADTHMHEPFMLEENNTVIPPKIAVIIPVYKQGHLLKDAVLSAVNQSIADVTKVIIVNDGCPRESTDRMGRYFSEIFRGRVFYLRKSNGGVSSARNCGIRFALDAWPSIETIFPLDADNKLSPLTLEKLWEKLSASEADVGWVYQDLTFFGAEHGVWDLGVPFSLYRLVHDNYCDAASLIRRGVFESGCWFDEQREQQPYGYEDWEFFLQAGLKGFRGGHLSDTGFLYRRRPFSRLASSQRKHDLMTDYIKRKHSHKFDTNQLNALEHLEMPRFALLTLESQRVSYFTNPNAQPSSQPLLSDFLNDLAARIEGPSCQAPYVPPILLFARKDIFALLRNLRLLPGMLIDFQTRLLRFECISVSVELADEPDVISIEPGAPTKKADLVCLGSFKFLELAQAGKERLEELLFRDSAPSKYNMRLRIGLSFLGNQYHYLIKEMLNEHDYNLGTKIMTVRNRCSQIIEPKGVKGVNQEAKWLVPDHTHYASWKHLQCEETSLPYHAEPKLSSKPINIFLLLDLCDLGGVKEVVLNLGKNLRRFNSLYRVHLLVTDAKTMRLDADCFKQFETISFLPSDMPESDRERLLLNMLSMADIVVNNHSLIGYRLLEQIRDKYQTKIISHLHVVDLDPENLPCGFPVIASREYEPLIDCYCVVSENLKRYCINLDVPEEKVVLLPNAPAVFPSSRESGLSIVNGKCHRTYSAHRPTKILFTGRFDRQKAAHRITSVAATLEELGAPAQFVLLGKSVFGGEETPQSRSNLKVLPPATDKQLLGQYYSDADIFLLLSRWEGVPLTILEAMTFGNIVIATDVGGVSEIVEDGNTGFLVDPTQPDDLLIGEVCTIILDIIQNPRKYDQLRMNAFSRAMDFSWAKSASILSGIIDSLIAEEGGI